MRFNYNREMFTGLVQAIGIVESLTPNPFGARLVIDSRDWSHRPERGDSIAVQGCCLTHAPETPGKGDTPLLLVFDVVRQTLDRTTLGDLKRGDPVNLESCLTPSTPIGGHFVQGHIDGVFVVEKISTSGEHRVQIRTDEDLIRYIVPTGSVAIDGVSLTIAAVDPPARTFAVALIPTTLRMTTLGNLQPGHRVNVETDILARTIVHYIQHFTSQNVR